MDVPSLPGCISEGETEEEALTNIKEAIEFYLEPIEDEIFITDSRIVKEITI
ncbi:MAG: type II toxin-antitoxin system HicB family antitoxin [Thermodesulfobacteriota bacterium]